jgi:uncharacterized membrane-anchored protein
MKIKLLALVLGLQVAWVFATVALQEFTLRSAPTVLLDTRPVDPRDMLRGDYVILSYNLSQIPLSQFQPPLTNQPPAGTTIYVVLEKRGTFHEAASASLTPPLPKPGQIVLRGTVEHAWQGGSVRVHYGLEHYFVAEGTGNPRGKLTVEAAVPKSGQATIKEVFLDGKPYRQAMREQAK